MLYFKEWLLVVEARQEFIPQAVLQGYELAFRDELKQLIDRTQNPKLRGVLADMLDCPIQDAKGNCRTFTDYIVAVIVRNGLYRQFDMEAALGYIVEKMLMNRLFGGFEERPDYTRGNPLLARFLKYLDFAVNNIRKGKIVRLANAERRPEGMVSISQGRQKLGDPSLGVSPDEIAAPASGQGDLDELIGDIETVLRQKERLYPLHLVDQFRAMLAGQTVDQQRKVFGDRNARIARQVIIQSMEDYARSSENYLLLRLLERLKAGESSPRRTVSQPTPRPKVSDQQRDYGSILSVVDRFERPIGSADLGRYRRRWLEYRPRDAESGHRNRMEEVLAKMVQDGVLRATRTPNGAWVYEPGPNADAHRQSPVAV